MTKKKINQIIEALKQLYPEAVCSLTYGKPHELLIATRLSAQCTDARVNIVTETLFKEFTSVEEFAQAPIERLEEIVHPCGLYKTKARDVKKMCQQLLENYGGKVPDSIEELTKLSGIGRKTANLIMGDIYGQPAYVCDTHCIRITNRLGITDSKDPLKVENQLRKSLPPEESNAFCHRTVLFGRDICTARSPKCDKCLLNDICPAKTM